MRDQITDFHEILTTYWLRRHDVFFSGNPPRGKKRGESDEEGVKNGEGKTEKLQMFPIFGGLPRL